MTELRLETMTIPAGDLGPENPLPSLHSSHDEHLTDDMSKIPEELRENAAHGRVHSILPYTLQDGYSRARTEQSLAVAVLENDILRATVALDLGGRLWSLVHKPSGRELLEANPVFQPANVAIRNAWFSGGVEWNIGTIGHSVFTCSPIHAARVEAPDGAPILRLYEWERIRQTPFQIDFSLPPGSPVLLVYVRIINPNDHDAFTYWWSNIAVPAHPDVRVLAPAESAYTFTYGGRVVSAVDIPIDGDRDVTYGDRIDQAHDWFYRIPDGRRRWITALDQAGRGLVQASTDRLKGRKLFVWGNSTGGERWQQWLSADGHRYVEIQAGLARTQAEHLRMPPRAQWTWLETYGLLEADPDAVHGADWSKAVGEVSQRLETLISAEELAQRYERCHALRDQAPAKMLHCGSGWGALEALRRQRHGEEPMTGDGLPFGADTLSHLQKPWVQLLNEGAFPAADPQKQPAYMVQASWRSLMEQAVLDTEKDNWLAWLHLGVMRHYHRDHEAACAAWERSLEIEENGWALRNLAIAARQRDQAYNATVLYAAAQRLLPHVLPLAVEYGQALLEAGMPGQWLECVESLPARVRRAGRVRFLEAQAAAQTGDVERGLRFFSEQTSMEDLREAEDALSDLWLELHALKVSAEKAIPLDGALRQRVAQEYPIPSEYDFRMHAGLPGKD